MPKYSTGNSELPKSTVPDVTGRRTDDDTMVGLLVKEFRVVVLVGLMIAVATSLVAQIGVSLAAPVSNDVLMVLANPVVQIVGGIVVGSATALLFRFRGWI